MIRVPRFWSILIFAACLCGVGCRLRRPETTPSRMIEPQLLEPQLLEPASQVTKAPNATPIRLLDTQSRAHIGRRLLHQQPDGELTEDPVWRWSSAPDRYLDTALHFEVASSRDMRLVDTGSAPALGATLLVWDLESVEGHDSSGLSSFRSRELIVWLTPKWYGRASPSHPSYLATWLPPRADFCATWRLRVSARRKRMIRKRGVADEVAIVDSARFHKLC